MIPISLVHPWDFVCICSGRVAFRNPGLSDLVGVSSEHKDRNVRVHVTILTANQLNIKLHSRATKEIKVRAFCEAEV